MGMGDGERDLGASPPLTPRGSGGDSQVDVPASAVVRFGTLELELEASCCASLA